jgi:hypothetical protein
LTSLRIAPNDLLTQWLLLPVTIWWPDVAVDQPPRA